MPPAVAAAAIGTAGTIYAGNKAADAQKDAAGQAAAVQKQMYQQGRSDNLPYQYAGYDALNEMAGLLGLPTRSMEDVQQLDAMNQGYTNALAKVRSIDNPKRENRLHQFGITDYGDFDYGSLTDQQLAELQTGKGKLKPKQIEEIRNLRDISQRRNALQTASANAPAADPSKYYDRFRNTPGYQFQMEEGEQALERQMAARGLGASGRAMKEALRFSQGLADQTYGQHFNRLGTLAGFGTSAAGQNAQMGQQYGNNMAQNRMAAGDARASGYINTANALNNGINQWGQWYGNSGGFGGPQSFQGTSYGTWGK